MHLCLGLPDPRPAADIRPGAHVTSAHICVAQPPRGAHLRKVLPDAKHGSNRMPCSGDVDSERGGWEGRGRVAGTDATDGQSHPSA